MLFNIHTHRATSFPGITRILSIDLTEDDRQESQSFFFSAGIHPWHAHLPVNNYLEKISSYIHNKNFLAVGECGLDKIQGPPFEIQFKIFEEQAKLAHELKKPVILHSVKSFPEIINLHDHIKPENPWIIHGFRKNAETALQLVKKGFILSFGNAVLKQPALSHVIESLDLKFIFLESDDLDSSILNDIYQKISEIKKIDLNQLKSIIQDNFERVFKVKPVLSSTFSK